MSQDLVLHLRQDGGVHWSVLDRASGARLRHGEIASEDAVDIPDLAGIARTLILLPTEDVFLTRITVPARTEREARQAAPFMIEDELASRLEDTEVALGARDLDGSRWVFAVDRSRLDAWQSRLAPAVVRPAFTLPDCLALTDHGAALQLYNRGDAVLVRLAESVAENGRNWGAGVGHKLFDRLLPHLVEKAGEGVIAVSASLGLAGANLTAHSDEDLDRAAIRMTEGELESLPALFGRQVRSSFDWSDTLRPWRRPASLAVALLVSAGLLVAGEGLNLKHQADRFDAASIALFEAAFPEVSGSVLPTRARRILDQRLAGAGGNSDGTFLTLTSVLSTLTSANDRVRIDHIRFDQDRSALTVSAIYSEFSDFDALSLEAQRLGVLLDDQGTREGDRGIEGDFVLRLQ